MRRYNYIASHKKTIANNLVNSNMNDNFLESYILILTMTINYLRIVKRNDQQKPFYTRKCKEGAVPE